MKFKKRQMILFLEYFIKHFAFTMKNSASKHEPCSYEAQCSVAVVVIGIQKLTTADRGSNTFHKNRSIGQTDSFTSHSNVTYDHKIYNISRSSAFSRPSLSAINSAAAHAPSQSITRNKSKIG